MKELDDVVIRVQELEPVVSSYLGNSPERDFVEEDQNCIYDSFEFTFTDKHPNYYFDRELAVSVEELIDLLNQCKDEGATHVYVVNQVDHQEIELHPYIFERVVGQEAAKYLTEKKEKEQKNLKRFAKIAELKRQINLLENKIEE